MTTRNPGGYLAFLMLWIGVWILAGSSFGEEPYPIIVPDIPDLEVSFVESNVIPNVRDATVFQFDDGRICVGDGGKTAWSSDGGDTWESGPAGPSGKTTLAMGEGRILSVARNTQRVPGDKFEGAVMRSDDNGKTFNTEKIVVDVPMTSALVGDDADSHDGFLFHHGILRLKNGDLMATMYGNYAGDTEMMLAYPAEFGSRKFRNIVVFSSDEGRTWGNPLMVGYKLQMVRDKIVPAVTQEGFCEADLVRAANGDILCVMRSGGRIGSPEGPVFPTPLYLSRSSDEGKTWTIPVQIADRGVNPNLIVLDNGVLVCDYTRPGHWLIFSDDNGQTWKGAFQYGLTSTYSNILEVAPNTIMVFHRLDIRDHVNNIETNPQLAGTRFTVKRLVEK